MLDLREAAVRLIDRSEPAPLLAEIERRARRRRARRRGSFITTAALLVGASVAAIALVPDRSDDAANGIRVETPGGHSPGGATIRGSTARLPLDAIPEGVTARTIGPRAVFLVRQDGSVTTYLTDPHGTPGLHILWWCPTEQLFVEPAHGAAFDVQGRIMGGPAQRGLDRLDTSVKRGTVTVDLRRVLQGSTAHSDRDTPPFGVEAWNTGPQSFCFQPVEGGRR